MLKGTNCVQTEVEKESNHTPNSSEYRKEPFTEKQVFGVSHLLRAIAGLRIPTIQIKLLNVQHKEELILTLEWILCNVTRSTGRVVIT